jgi:hypothetical protein
MSKTKKIKYINKTYKKKNSKNTKKSKLQSKKSKLQSKKSKLQSKKSKLQSKTFTARIIIKDNIGGIVADKNTIKEIIESIGGDVEVVVYNDIKDKLHTQYHSKLYSKVNLQFFIEHSFLENPLNIFPADKSYIFVNQEYIQDWDIALMQSKTLIPLCKTKESLKTLSKLGITTSKYVGFGNNNQFEYINKIDKIPDLFIHIVGSSPLKGTKTLIDTWIHKHIKQPLIITANNKSGGNTKLFKYWKSLKPKLTPLPERVLEKWEEWKQIIGVNMNTKLPSFEKIEYSSIYFCNTVLDYSIIQFLQSVAELHMCPSLIEGWGQYIDEGRRAKAVVLTLDAAPMNELISDNNRYINTGILVKALKGPSMKQLLPYGWTQYFTKNKEYNKFLYTTYKTNINDLYNGINRILKMSPEQKRKLGVNALKQSQYDYTEFKKQFIKVLQI